MADFDPDTDLRLTCHLPAGPDEVWRCWADPQLFLRWFAGAAAGSLDATLDLRPGGAFEVAGAYGAAAGYRGCVIAAEPSWRLAWTDALREGWRPASGTPARGAQIMSLKIVEGGTRLTLILRGPEGAARPEAGVWPERLAALASLVAEASAERA